MKYVNVANCSPYFVCMRTGMSCLQLLVLRFCIVLTFMLASAVGLLQTVNSNLHSCNLLSSLAKNNLKSAGFLVAGPLTVCLCEQPRRNLSCDLIEEL